MAKKFLVDLDLNTNELQNAVVQNLPLSSEPAGEKGRVYFESTNNLLKVYNGNAWQSLLTSGSIILGTDTVGNYVGSLTASTGVSITGGTGEGVTNVISIGQPVATTDSPTFAALTTTGDIALNGGDLTTTSTGTTTIFNTNTTTLNIGGAATAVNIGAVTGTTTVNNSLTVIGDLLVSGSVTTLNTATLFVEDNVIILNSNTTGGPTLSAGVEIERGDSTNVSILWNEDNDVWTLTNNGTDYANIVRKYSSTITSSSALSYIFTHNLNTRDVVVNVYQNSGNYDTVEVDIYRNSANQVTVGFTASPSVDYRVVVTG